MDSSIILSLAPNVDFCYPPGKRLRITAPSIFKGEEEMKGYDLLKKQRPSIDVLPDECLFEILRRLPRRQTRSIAACVSKRWLMLLSSIQPSEDMEMLQKESELLRSSRKSLPDLNYPVPPASDLNLDIGSDRFLSRCLEADEATDIKLAAFTLCASVRGGLRELKIRGGNSTCGVTDVGLSVIGRSCPFLRVLHIWKLPLISDKGLLSIADGCPMLENLDLCDCPLITDKGLVAIALKCPNLTSLTIDSCSRISNDGFQAVGRYCPKLLSISIKDCPLVGDKGVSNLVTCAASSLKKIKLQNVDISDVSLAVIGHYGKAVTSISLTALQKVNERGFWVMGNARNMVSLTSCTISCSGITDRSLEAIAKGCPQLKQLGIRMSHNLSDTGLISLTGFARTLESLQLEECNGITLRGVLDMLSNGCTRFRSLVLVKCLGIRDLPLQVEELPTCRSLQSLTIRDSPGFTSTSLSAIVKISPNLRQIDLSGLVGVTDAVLLPLAESSKCGLVKANFEECVNLSDASICALVEAHGSSLKQLNLAGCKMVTDRSLLAISVNCSVLKDLDVSRCSLSDYGVAAIASASLRTLSLAGCAGVTKRSIIFLGEMKESLMGLNLQQCKVMKTSGAGSLGKKLWWCEILS